MKHKLIYVANKEKNIIHLLEYILFSKEGYIIKSFTSEKDLMAGLNKKPDIIVLDSFNKSLDTLREIKQQNKEVPVIILSKKNEKDKEMQFIENGAFKCISQSGYFLDRLVDTLDQALQPKISA